MHEVKHSVALVVRDDSGRFLIVKRPDDPADPLRSVWGLPAITLRSGEDERAAAARAGVAKLGVTLAIGRRIGGLTVGSLELSDYEATILEGKPTVPQPDTSMTQYTDFRFTSDPSTLEDAARRGSLCARIFLSAKE
jgi:hypothetical protein